MQLSAAKRHSIKSCRDVTLEFVKDGHYIFHKYTGAFFVRAIWTLNLLLRDLGQESNMNFYGNQCSVMAEIILFCFDPFHLLSIITHITLNLNSCKIEERYWVRVRSRCRELFNLIALHANGLDKRKWIFKVETRKN